MIPISLTIEGLYSYREKQIIDFETLTSNQLFGIFGAVGSGKSSILEAIIFAIYNESDRLNKSGDNRYYNMMNLQANYLLIDFICYTGVKAKEKYRFIFEAKRSKKNFEEVKTPDRRVFKEVNGNWEAQENYNINEIIGMNAKNFRQTVIIPQGKFRDFIEMGGTDRTKMLQELFQLDKFDLYDNTRRLISENKEQIITLNTRVESLEKYTSESLNEHEESAGKLKTDIAKQTAKLKEVKANYDIQLKLKELLEEKENLTQWLKSKEDKKNLFEKRKVVLDKYDLADRLFKEKILQESKLNNQINLKDTEIQSTASQLNRVELDLREAEIKFKKIKEDYNQKEEKQTKLNDLEIIIRIKKAEEKLNTITQTFTVLQSKKNESQQKLQDLQKKEQQLDAQLKLVKAESTDINWLKDAEALLANKEKEEKRREILQGELASLKNEFDSISQKQKALAKEVDFNGKTETVNFTAYIQQQLATLTNQLIQLESEKKYETDRNLLEEGKPCPLCGSTHHPALQTQENHLQNLDEIQNKTKKIQTNSKSFEKALTDWQQYENELNQLKTIIDGKEDSIKNISNELEQLEAKAEEKSITQLNTNEIRQKLEQQKSLTSQIDAIEKNLDEIRLGIQQERKISESTNEAFSASNTEKSTLENSIIQDKTLLKILQYEGKLAKLSLQQLQESAARGIKQLAEIESIYKEEEQKYNQLQLEKKGIESTLTSEQKNLSSLRKEFENIRNEIHQLIEKEDSFSDFHEVQYLLKQNIDISKERIDIEDFKKQWEQAILSLQTIKEKIGENDLNTEAFEALKNELDQLEILRTTSQNELAITKEQIKTIKENLKLKRDYEIKLNESLKRADNLKVMASLFKAKGFVEFVSSIFLKNLVGIANKRFMQLTKNNLSLELNETNDFIVRDYLNNGRTRLLKTLSGGQTFQAALCLALAMAEHVKSLNTSERSFFFLDEGFGTLDRQALQIVFETLRSLQKENRIVGVISHVEDLQQEIDVALLVKNNPEKGSEISYSWL